jgi:hypothetical protein
MIHRYYLDGDVWMKQEMRDATMKDHQRDKNDRWKEVGWH